MALATFGVRLPEPDGGHYPLEELRAWLRRRFRGNAVFRIVAIPSRVPGEFEIAIEFPRDERLLGVIFTQLLEAVSEVAPGSTLETIQTDLGGYPQPVLDQPGSVPELDLPWDTATLASRYVNTLILLAGIDDEVPRNRPLLLATDYTLLVRIGEYDQRSLLPAGEARFPDESLPAGGSWLRAALLQDGSREAVVQPFFLPDAGSSFACDCPAGGPHLDGCARRPWVRLPLRTPCEPALVRAELAIYYQAAAVHVEQLVLPVGDSMPGGPRTRSVGWLTRSFRDLGKLAGRSLSLVVPEASSRMLVNATGFTASVFDIPANAADTSARNARQALYDSHFHTPRRQLRSRYAADHSKPAAEFHNDLRQLAQQGYALYQRMFLPAGADTGSAATLPQLLRLEADLRGRPPVIQVVDGRAGEHTMLWSVIYDIPFTGPEYEVCESLHQFGPGGEADGDPPAFCPHGQDHLDRGDVLCPYGFWGLSCLIEQPPSVGRDLETVVLRQQQELSIGVAPDDSLDAQLTAQHLHRLRECLPERSIAQPPIGTEQELKNMLGPETMDLVYFYCHSGYARLNRLATVDNYLNLGKYQIKPEHLAKWAMSRAWPYPHWPDRHPVVVINGCHTAEETSGTLNSFVRAFVHWAAASGVVGTEVLLEQGLAGWAMELMLTALARGASVGDAVRQMRWAMLGRGNVMGLAYTPYCLANLSLRQWHGVA